MLPNGWYIKGCKELKVFLEDIHINEVYTKANISGGNPNWGYYLEKPTHWNGWEKNADSFKILKEVTFEEFEKYVLNKPPEVKEDMSHLVEVLKKWNIK